MHLLKSNMYLSATSTSSGNSCSSLSFLVSFPIYGPILVDGILLFRLLNIALVFLIASRGTSSSLIPLSVPGNDIILDKRTLSDFFSFAVVVILS